MAWNVKVPREQLLEQVILNRDNHKAIVGKALDRYRDAVVNELDKMIKKAKAGKEIDSYIRLPRPEDHTGDYDTVIGMLQMSVETVVSLGPSEYRAYVEDKWDWTERFAASNATYGV